MAPPHTQTILIPGAGALTDLYDCSWSRDAAAGFIEARVGGTKGTKPIFGRGHASCLSWWAGLNVPRLCLGGRGLVCPAFSFGIYFPCAQVGISCQPTLPVPTREGDVLPWRLASA